MKSKDSKKVTVNLSIDSRILEELRKESSSQNMSLNAKINSVLLKHVDFHRINADYGCVTWDPFHPTNVPIIILLAQIRKIRPHGAYMTYLTNNLTYLTTDIKEELETRYGIPVDDISRLGAIVNQVSQLFGYDASKVVYALSNLESLKAEYAKYQTWTQEVKTDYYGLSQEKSELQNVVASCKQSLSVYNQLAADMNFGLKELKLLWNTILEIASANNIPREQAVSKFFKDIEQQYDDKLGFESKIDKLQVEVNKLNRQELKLLGEINAIPRLGLALLKLFNMNDDNNNNIDEEIEVLIDKVRKSGGIKAVIRKLNQTTDEEEKQEVLVDRGNKSSGNKQIEKQEARVGVREEGSHDEEDANEVELRRLFKEAMENMPAQDNPEEPLFWKSE
ncbi:MAG TPA: hypothetical protein VFI70_07120 [Nitrososphaeraceae archaeon]|nr:hypothetical protein [Nitrososphaeraceae archaeon]